MEEEEELELKLYCDYKTDEGGSGEFLIKPTHNQ
jgi:hypothetical protein